MYLQNEGVLRHETLQLFLFLFPLRHMKRPALQNKQARVLRMAFRDFRETGPWTEIREIVLLFRVMNLYSTFCKLWIYGWDQTPAYTGASGSRYQSISDLIQTMIEWNKAYPQHWELHALLFTTSMLVCLCSTGFWSLTGCEMGPMVYHPSPRRLVSLTICRCRHHKGSTSSSVILGLVCWFGQGLNPWPSPL